MVSRIILKSITGFKKYLIVTSLLLNAGFMLYLYRLFLLAYASQEKAVTLYINVYGEANQELVLMTGSAILGIAGLTIVLLLLRQRIFPIYRKPPNCRNRK